MANIRATAILGIATVATAGSGLFSLAAAQGVELYIGGPPPAFDYREFVPDAPRDEDHQRLAYDGCGPRRALREARRFGLSDVEIAREGRRRVMVDGYDYATQENVRLVFANVPGCPLIDRY